MADTPRSTGSRARDVRRVDRQHRPRMRCPLDPRCSRVLVRGRSAVSAPELERGRGGRSMRLKHALRTTAVVAAVMTVGLIAGSARADVWTDRNVYQAGDTVIISGDGMQAGESVGVEVFLPDASLAQHHDVLADSQGNFSDSYTLPA